MKTDELKPYDWQVPNIDRLVRSVREHGMSCDTSDTGAGKTIAALHTAKQLGLVPWVIAPKPTIPAWKEAIQLINGTGLVIGYEACRTGKYPVGEWAIKKRRWKWTPEMKVLIIFDEAHRTTAPTTQTAKLLTAASRQGIPHLLLSATLCDSPLKMKAAGYSLGLHDLQDWRFFLLRNKCVKTQFGLEYVGGAEHMAVIRERCGIRMGGIKVSELGDKFPARMVDAILLPSPGADDEYEAALKVMESDAEIELTATLRARQIAEWRKRDEISVMVKDANAEGNACCVFVNFRETALALHKKVESSLVIGEQSADERAGAIERFQANQVGNIILTMGSGGEGISLGDLHGKPRVAFVVPGWSARELVQAVGRTHRANSLSPAIVHLLFSVNSEIEQRIRAKITGKLANIAALNDNDLSIL